jgi:hypothetical protein
MVDVGCKSNDDLQDWFLHNEDKDFVIAMVFSTVSLPALILYVIGCGCHISFQNNLQRQHRPITNSYIPTTEQTKLLSE